MRIPLLLLLLPLFGYGQEEATTTLRKDIGRYEVLGTWQHWEDKQGNTAFDEVRSQHFSPSRQDLVPTFGFSRSTWWFKGSIRNQSDQRNWIVEVAYAPLDDLELFFFDREANQWKSLKSGDRYPISARPVRFRHPIFLLHLDKENTHEIYLRVKSNSSVQVPIVLWDTVHFYDHDALAQFANGLFYGIMLIMAVYHLFLFFSIRDKNALLYALSLISGANVVAFFQGYGFLYLYPEWPELNNLFSSISGPLFILCSALLTRNFLNLRRISILLDRLILFNTLLTIAITIAISITFPLIRMSYLHYFTFIHCALVLVSAFYCWRRRYRPARYFLLAWTTLLVAGALFSLKNLGFIPANYITDSALYVGGIMQTMLIALALGDRVNLLLRENQEARERELIIEQAAKAKLEVEVRNRTEEIVQKNHQLHESNEFKSKLFSVLSHDIKAPMNTLRGTLGTLKMGALTQEEFKAIASQLDQQLLHTNAFVDNLLQWTRNQLDGEVHRPGVINLQELVSETIILMKEDWQKKKIRIQNNVRHPLLAFADANMIRAVVRNLFSNAIKFTQLEGTISFLGAQEGNRVTLQISDTGIGIPQENQAQLFTINSISTPGTLEERGTGLGLVLCREFVEKNHGQIWCTSVPGQGSTFAFSLPARH